MAKETGVFIKDFKGNDIFAVHDIDEDGNQFSEKSIVQMGRRKLQAIVNHIEEAKTFLNEKKEKAESKPTRKISPTISLDEIPLSQNEDSSYNRI